MLDRIGEFFIFGFAPLVVAMLAAPDFSHAGERAVTGEDSLVEVAWLAEDIRGRGVMDTARSTLHVRADGSISGLGACNRYFGSVSIKGSSISFSGIGATMMACAPALMDQERKLFDALKEAASFRFEQGKLFLVDAQGRDLVRFAKDS